jgi:predicted transposase YbfD/YdcC
MSPTLPSANPAASIFVHFSTLVDPRIDRCKLHPIENILTISLLGMLCGFGDFKGFELFGSMKSEWLETFLDLRNGVPSHDTFGRFFAALSPEEFGRCFSRWTCALADNSEGRIISIDGKTLRGSFDTAAGTSPIHIVSAFVQANRMVLGQLATDAKSNEITAIPKLLGLLNINGATVTIDAMGTQREIVKEIVAGGANYVLPIKENQPTMFREVSELLNPIADGEKTDIPVVQFETIEKGHGRIETRKLTLTSHVDWFENTADWDCLNSFAVIDRTRVSVLDGTTTSERSYYLSSLPGEDAEEFLRILRAHWGIENQLHWCLDVQFAEDNSRIRRKHSAENISTIRRTALNLLQQNPTPVGLNKKRLMACSKEGFLLELLGIKNSSP